MQLEHSSRRLSSPSSLINSCTTFYYCLHFSSLSKASSPVYTRDTVKRTLSQTSKTTRNCTQRRLGLSDHRAGFTSFATRNDDNFHLSVCVRAYVCVYVCVCVCVCFDVCVSTPDTRRKYRADRSRSSDRNRKSPFSLSCSYTNQRRFFLPTRD